MKLCIDENVDVRVAEGLRLRGIDATTVREEGLLGAPDEVHFDHALKSGMIIFTHEHHFVQIAADRTSREVSHPGVIFCPMNRFNLGRCIRRLALYADLVSAEEMRDRVDFL